MTEYSCKPAPAAGPGAFILTIEFDRLRWASGRPTFGVRGLYRPKHLGMVAGAKEPKIIEDPDHLLSAIADLEAIALRERPQTENIES